MSIVPVGAQIDLPTAEYRVTFSADLQSSVDFVERADQTLMRNELPFLKACIHTPYFAVMNNSIEQSTNPSIYHTLAVCVPIRSTGNEERILESVVVNRIVPEISV